MSLTIKRLPPLQMFKKVCCHHCWNTEPVLIDLWWFPERSLLDMGWHDLYVSQFCRSCAKMLVDHCTHFTSVTQATAHLIAERLTNE